MAPRKLTSETTPGDNLDRISPTNLRDDPVDSRDTLNREILSKGLHRRVVLRIAKQFGRTLAFTPALHSAYEAIRGCWHFDRDSDENLLFNLFGPGRTQSVALIPAAHHKWKAPPKGMYWYPLDGACADAYRQRFSPEAVLRTVPGFPHVAPQDGIALFGSQMSNLYTLELLGDPFQEKPNLEVVKSGWMVDLWWNVHCPPGMSETERQQLGQRLSEPNQHVIGRDGTTFEPKVGMGWIADDYLLVTVLPKYSRGFQRVVVFAGCHGEGTLSAGEMLAQPPVPELQQLQRRIQGEPWYQALFHVSIRKTPSGDFLPNAVKLVDAKPLLVRFQDSPWPSP